VEYEKLVVKRANGYVVAALNHPPANALCQEVLLDLNAFLDECLEDDAIRAIVITGTGEKIFCAGADVTEFAKFKAGMVRRIHALDVFSRIENYPKPVIAAVQGSAFGGGLELAMVCHLRLLSASAKLGQPEVKLGIMPGWGGTQRLPRLIGKTRAMEMILLGDPITADKALEWGLVNRVVPADAVVAEAEAIVAKLALNAPLALREAINAITMGLETTLQEGIEIEQSGQSFLKTTEDAIEGPAAFKEKRPPRFTGK
jgi:enoyl-CoA hydratase